MVFSVSVRVSPAGSLVLHTLTLTVSAEAADVLRSRSARMTCKGAPHAVVDPVKVILKGSPSSARVATVVLTTL
jgi:hypothetical protein